MYAKTEGDCPKCGKDDAEETLEISGEHLHVLKKCLRCETDFVEVYDMTWVDMSHYNPKES